MNIRLLKSGKVRLLFVLVAWLWSGTLVAQSLQTHVDSDSIRIGDIFHYSLTLQLDQEYTSISFPDTSAFPSSLDLNERQRFRLSEFSDSVSYRFQYFGNNDIQLPSIPVRLYSDNDSTTLYSQPVTLFFKSVVAEGDTTFKSMKPNFLFPRPWWPWILAAVALLGFLIWWFNYRNQTEDEEKSTKPTIEPFYNPLEELESTLITIKKDTRIAETKDFKTFYSEVGDAIRQYFEDLYNIPALESTSTELLRYLEAYGVDDILIDKTRIVLRKADLVKFAKFTPTLDDAWDTYDTALDFLERAKLTDSGRITRLKAEYNEQFKLESSENKEEKA